MTSVISHLNDEEIDGSCYEKELQKTNQKGCRIEKVIKRKGNSNMSNGKDIIAHLIVRLIKKKLYKKESKLS